ncbi:MAG: DUF2029 domain-containing protein [Clostridia bacterium]|nr:DUF2029 domain-containing protein [Clostridia bacterium]
MDFFNVNYFVVDMDPYIARGSSYPPFALLIAKLFSISTNYLPGPVLARETIGGMASLIILFILSLAIALILLRKICKKHGVSVLATLMIFVAFLISAPILFEINRGNYLILALVFSAVFLVYYKDERRWARELSYVALAVAAGIKLYPAAFALVLLKNKRFLDFGKVALYSVCLVLFPFFAFKGGFIANVKAFMHNLSSWTGSPYLTSHNLTGFYSNDVSVKNLFVMLCAKVSGKEPWTLTGAVQNTGLTFGIFISVAMAAVSLVSKSGWRRLSAIGLIIVLFPSVSAFYSVTFMLIPFTAFLINIEEDKNKIAYWVFYLILFCPLSIGYFIKPLHNGLVYGYTLMNWLQGLSMIAMAIMLFVETLIDFIKDRKLKLIEKTAKTDKVEI